MLKVDKYVELDKYESQLLLLSKNHFQTQLEELNIDTFEALKRFWSFRCALDIKYVEISSILRFTYELMTKCLKVQETTEKPLAHLEAMHRIMHGGYMSEKYTPPETFEDLLKIEITACMHMISGFQVLSTKDNHVMIDRLDKDPSFLTEYYDRSKEDIGEIIE